MKAMTVRQPWAWAIIYGQKDVENRGRNIAGSYRGPLVIHAAIAQFEQHNMASRAHRAAHGTETPTQLHFGAALGIVDLTNSHWSGMEGGLSCAQQQCHEYERCSSWAEAYSQHLALANPRPFLKPIPYRGRLGLWEFPDDLLPEVGR